MPPASRSVALLLVALAGSLPAPCVVAQEARPNVVLFLVDDLGWQDTSVPLHSEPTALNRRYRTPNMVRLAAEGMTFTSAYAASPVCTPTRVSLMTGSNPARHRITNWTLHADRDTSAGHPTLRPPDWNRRGLQPDSITLPALLRDAGYRTIHVGKAHFGAIGTPGADPRALGFDVNIAGHAAGGPGSYYGRDHYSATLRDRNPSASHVWDVPDLAAYHDRDVHLTAALTAEARRAVADAVAAGLPFFLNLAHYAVHAPIMRDPAFVAGYDDLEPREAAYASLIEGVDRSLGEVLAQLDRLDQERSTVVLFMSDNGGLSAHGRGGPPHVHNAPLRSGKGSAYEGGIRVPMIVRWPGRVRPGARVATPVISDDFFATILATCGVAIPARHVGRVDGRDLTPLLRGGPAPSLRVLGFHYPHQWGAPGPGIHPFTAIRFGRWKLIYFHAEPRFELYDLVSDVGERHDLAASKPGLTRELALVMQRWLEGRDAQMSVDRVTGEPVRSPAARDS